MSAAKLCLAVLLIAAVAFIPYLLTQGRSATISYALQLLLFLVMCASPIVAIVAIGAAVRAVHIHRLEAKEQRQAVWLSPDEFDAWHGTMGDQESETK